MLDPYLEHSYLVEMTLINQYLNLRISQYEIDASKSNLFPSLSLNAGAEMNRTRMKLKEQDANTDNSFRYYANLSLSYTLSNGGRVKRAIQNAKIDNEISQLQTEEMKITMSNNLTFRLDQYELHKQLFLLAKEKMESAQLNLQIATEKHKAGTLNSFNYRDIQIMYLNAAFDKLKSTYNLFDTQTELMRLTGSIISEE